MKNKTQKCPMCAEQIPFDATVCEFCGTKFEAPVEESQPGRGVREEPIALPRPPVQPTPAMLPYTLTKKLRPPWGWIAGGLGLLVILALVCGGILIAQNGLTILPASQVPSETLAPTPIIILSSTPTFIPTLTPDPTSTTAPVPVWVADFAEPILSAIANQTPKIDDDFSDNTGGWQCPSWRQDAKLDLIDGELVFGNACVATRSNMAFTDFVLEIDERFLQGSSSNWLRIDFRDIVENPEDHLSYQLQINHNGSFSLNWPPTHKTVEITFGKTPLESKTNRILIIVKGSRIAFFVDGEPLYYLTDTTISQRGRIKFTAYAMIALDNLKIWDISDLP